MACGELGGGQLGVGVGRVRGAGWVVGRVEDWLRLWLQISEGSGCWLRRGGGWLRAVTRSEHGVWVKSGSEVQLANAPANVPAGSWWRDDAAWHPNRRHHRPKGLGTACVWAGGRVE